MPASIAKSVSDLKKGASLYNVWFYQAYHEISAKYKHTMLGSLWIAGGMVTTSLALSLVFGIIQGQSLKDILPFVMGGILTFGLVSFIFNEGPEVFLSAAGTIKNHAYPFTYFVFEGVSRSFLTFLHNLVVFYITLVCVGSLAVPNWTVIFGLPILLVSMFFWGAFFGMMAARFRDLRFIMPYISQLLFFTAPIFWKADGVKGAKALFVDLNPVYGLVEIVRSPLLGKMPPEICWLQALLTMVVGGIVWFAVFTSFRRRIPFWV
ncbi:ABC transporter permease [Asticcacaulis sp. EMRT-3]|uniref:ABC transporter permease n=1 Tax=Asticcacaulis sp. EMRT-3 TaxID=3040349 RepID=UPI0024AF9A69|nr:ABC transporter permease [Asticcacaulis sp. EMRT-3]MDI7776358.1 ABC transporter permease [Asticcacaulis sp. EMRT-3]